MTSYLLSILICTIEGREEELDKVRSELDRQIAQSGASIEILTFSDDKSIPVGDKRNKLLSIANGKYTCFVDDDDMVSPNYIKHIIQGLNQDVDCVGIKGIITFSGKNPRTFIHSIQYDKYFENGGVYYRPPNHLNPIKREIALKFKFPVKNCGEDTDWAMSICKAKALRSEWYIEEPIYYYQYDHNKTATQRK